MRNAAGTSLMLTMTSIATPTPAIVAVTGTSNGTGKCSGARTSTGTRRDIAEHAAPTTRTTRAPDIRCIGATRTPTNAVDATTDRGPRTPAIETASRSGVRT